MAKFGHGKCGKLCNVGVDPFYDFKADLSSIDFGILMRIWARKMGSLFLTSGGRVWVWLQLFQADASCLIRSSFDMGWSIFPEDGEFCQPWFLMDCQSEAWDWLRARGKKLILKDASTNGSPCVRDAITETEEYGFKPWTQFRVFVHPKIMLKHFNSFTKSMTCFSAFLVH